MGNATKIQWCDSTVNPVDGCSGCELWTKGRRICYAGFLHERFAGNPDFSAVFDFPTLFPGRMKKAARWRDLAGRPRLDKPWLDGCQRLIFVSDMGDALSEGTAISEDNQPLPDGVPFRNVRTVCCDDQTKGTVAQAGIHRDNTGPLLPGDSD